MSEKVYIELDETEAQYLKTIMKRAAELNNIMDNQGLTPFDIRDDIDEVFEGLSNVVAANFTDLDGTVEIPTYTSGKKFDDVEHKNLLEDIAKELNMQVDAIDFCNLVLSGNHFEGSELVEKYQADMFRKPDELDVQVILHRCYEESVTAEDDGFIRSYIEDVCSSYAEEIFLEPKFEDKSLEVMWHKIKCDMELNPPKHHLVPKCAHIVDEICDNLCDDLWLEDNPGVAESYKGGWLEQRDDGRWTTLWVDPNIEDGPYYEIWTTKECALSYLTDNEEFDVDEVMKLDRAYADWLEHGNPEVSTESTSALENVQDIQSVETIDYVATSWAEER